MIEGGHYGEAGALNFYRKKYDLPEAASFDASFLLWVPEKITFDRQIVVHDWPQGPSDYFENVILVDSTATPFAREVSYIYYRNTPKKDVESAWTQIVQERRLEGLGE